MGQHAVVDCRRRVGSAAVKIREGQAGKGIKCESPLPVRAEERDLEGWHWDSQCSCAKE